MPEESTEKTSDFSSVLPVLHLPWRKRKCQGLAEMNYGLFTQQVSLGVSEHRLDKISLPACEFFHGHCAFPSQLDLAQDENALAGRYADAIG